MKISIASGNQHKVNEIISIIKTAFPRSELNLTSVAGRNIPEPEEPYATFAENSYAKAKYYAAITGEPTLSEDSGLCITALDGYPGVYTKDLVLESGGIQQAQDKLRHMLVSHQDYSAYFICVATLFFPKQNNFLSAEGKYFGRITFPPRGDKGFAFDPIFIPDGYDNTIAELGEDLKNILGHRAIAIKGIIEKLSMRPKD